MALKNALKMVQQHAAVVVYEAVPACAVVAAAAPAAYEEAAAVQQSAVNAAARAALVAQVGSAAFAEQNIAVESAGVGEARYFAVHSEAQLHVG